MRRGGCGCRGSRAPWPSGSRPSGAGRYVHLHLGEPGAARRRRRSAQRAGPVSTWVSRRAAPTASSLPVDTLTSCSFPPTSRTRQSAGRPGVEVGRPRSARPWRACGGQGRRGGSAPAQSPACGTASRPRRSPPWLRSRARRARRSDCGHVAQGVTPVGERIDVHGGGRRRRESTRTPATQDGGRAPKGAALGDPTAPRPAKHSGIASMCSWCLAKLVDGERRTDRSAPDRGLGDRPSGILRDDGYHQAW